MPKRKQKTPPRKSWLRKTPSDNLRQLQLVVLNAQGKSDYEIALILQMLPRDVREYRESVGLRANPPAEQKQVLELHQGGKTDTEIARALSISRRDTTEMRLSMGLPANPTERQRDVLELHRQGKTDSEISKILQLSRQRIEQLRRPLGLSPNPPAKTTITTVTMANSFYGSALSTSKD
jgi:DNA-binding CsgD family transcriptional regulator